MSTVRLRRLQADHEKLLGYVRGHPRVQLVGADGDPPERYRIEFALRSLRKVNEELITVDSHLVEIYLPGSYPRLPPQCRMLTPIFHPNIAPHAICVGDHWSAGEPLWSLVSRIGEMIAYRSYNVKSPLNGEAARWVSENLGRLPLDATSLLIEEARQNGDGASSASGAPAAAASRPPAPVASARSPTTPCPQCQSMLKVSASHAGKRARCPRCKTEFVIPANLCTG